MGSSTPTHPHLLKVVHGENYTSRAISQISLPPGSLFTKITTATPSAKAYTSIQVSATQHMELNSDLVYVNHSCDPSLEWDMAKMEIRVARGKALEVGDELTFFYPSSEWDMDRGFECICGTSRCIGVVRGSRHLSREVLEGWWINEFVWELVAKRDGGDAKANGKDVGLEKEGKVGVVENGGLLKD